MKHSREVVISDNGWRYLEIRRMKRVNREGIRIVEWMKSNRLNRKYKLYEMWIPMRYAPDVVKALDALISEHESQRLVSSGC